MTYQPRSYRQWVDSKDLVAFNVMVKETDLYVLAQRNLKQKCYRLVIKYREALEKYIGQHPDFLVALEPVCVPGNAPAIVKKMAEAAREAKVGPMAAVAGAIAEFVGNELAQFSPELIIENGGDIYIRSARKRVAAIYAGESPLSGRIGLEIEPRGGPVGISTSSGTVGHSLSFGKADAVVVVAPSATLSDAAATALGNLVSVAEDIPAAIEAGKAIRGLTGMVMIKGASLGVWGDIKLCETGQNPTA